MGPLKQYADRLPSVWRNPDFRILWGGQIVSALGSEASGLALPLLLLSLTHSAATTGLLTALRGLSTIVIPLPVGVLVDRWDRKRIIMVSELGRAAALGSIPVAAVTSHLSLLQLVAVSMVEGTLQNVFALARSASLLRVVGEAELGDALAFGSLGAAVSRLLGPSLGGSTSAASGFSSS